MLFTGLSLVAIGGFGHLYFGVKYRSFFVVDKHSLHRSSWSMIKDLKAEHPVAAHIYIGVYCVSLIGLVLIAAEQISFR
jgi:hypothetical protein